MMIYDDPLFRLVNRGTDQKDDKNPVSSQSVLALYDELPDDERAAYFQSRPRDWPNLPEPDFTKDDIYWLIDTGLKISTTIQLRLDGTGSSTTPGGDWLIELGYIDDSGAYVVEKSKEYRGLTTGGSIQCVSPLEGLPPAGRRYEVVHMSALDSAGKGICLTSHNAVEVSAHLVNADIAICESDTTDTVLREVTLYYDRPAVLTNTFRYAAAVEAIRMYVPKETHVPITNAYAAFRACERLRVIPSCIDWSRVKSMLMTFYGCKSLGSISLFGAVAGQMTSLQYTFEDCRNMTEVTGVDTSAATDIGSLFYGCYRITELPDIDMSACTKIDYAFYDCWNLRRLVLKNFGQNGNHPSLEHASLYHFASSPGLLESLLFETPADTIDADCSLRIDHQKLGLTAIVDLFRSLPAVTVASTLNITGNPGAREPISATDIQIATDKGWTVVGAENIIT